MTKWISMSLMALALGSCRLDPGSQASAIPDYTRKQNWNSWSLQLSSINVWGLAVISKDRSERMPAIGRLILDRKSEFAFIQEAWTPEDRRKIQESSRLGVMESFNPSGQIGSGLATLAQVPTLRRTQLEFAVNGKLSDVHTGDPASQKGISLTTIDWKGLPISMFNTHTLSRTENALDPEDYLTAQRLAQMFEIFSFVVEQSDSDAWILAGDFNIRFNHTEYRLLDALLNANINMIEDQQPGFCTSCSDNDYTKGHYSGQIDFVILSPRLSFADNHLDFNQKFQGTDGKFYNYSDHYGWTSKIKVAPSPRFSSAMVRQRVQGALAEIRQRLEDEAAKSWFITLGLEERLVIKQRLKDVANKVALYQEALSSQVTTNSRVLTIRSRLESYLSFFD